jgi:hypothetical protein
MTVITVLRQNTEVWTQQHTGASTAAAAAATTKTTTTTIKKQRLNFSNMWLYTRKYNKLQEKL